MLHLFTPCGKNTQYQYQPFYWDDETLESYTLRSDGTVTAGSTLSSNLVKQWIAESVPGYWRQDEAIDIGL